MKRLLAILASASLLLAGCAHHSALVEGDTVTLSLTIPHAREVLFASSLDGYELHPVLKTGNSAWVIQLPADRQFSYFYVVDGNVYIPDCSLTEHDDFGSRDCVFAPGM